MYIVTSNIVCDAVIMAWPLQQFFDPFDECRLNAE